MFDDSFRRGARFACWVALFVLVACTSSSASMVTTPTDSDDVSDDSATRSGGGTGSSARDDSADDEPDVLRMPLTGEPLEDATEIPQRPALVVKIPMDDPAAMPHAGLNRADVVFQTIINDRLTRLLAVFQSQSADPLGPIRSGRDQDIPLIAEFRRPLVGWSGGNSGVARQMRAAAGDRLLVDLSFPDHPQLFYRRADRPGAPHNLFTSTDALWSQTPADFVVPTPVFPYLPPGAEPEGDPVDEISVLLDSVRSQWRYDPATGRYLKWNNGTEHMTEQDGQVWADNVVVAVLDYGISPIDANNPLASSIGSNPVFIFSRGTVRSGSWVRLDPSRGWGFFDNVTDLNEIGLVPGRTWVELPRSQAGVLTYQSDGATVTADTRSHSSGGAQPPSAAAAGST